MILSIVPEKMEGGMIYAILVQTDGKEEIFNIPPAPFETFEGIKVVIAKHYETEALWVKAKQEYEAVKERFDLIDFRHTEAQEDFRLLIAPKIEPKAAVVPESKEEPVITIRKTTPEPETPKKIIIIPPEPPAAPQAPATMQERAEKAGEELKNATVIIDRSKEIVQEQKPADSDMVKMFKDHSTILTSEVKDMLPNKAKGVLEDMQKRIEIGQAAADLSKPLEVQSQKQKSVLDWVKEVDKIITDRLMNTEFDEARLDAELANCGVPKEQLEKVKKQLIESWKTDELFENKEEAGFFLKLKEKILGKKEKKAKPKKS